ncbi:MAG: RDD domain-containing protein [Limisphaerales bacterium]|nr:MAG: RDD domain-containing protein [Limisphaerales bacterium]TXT48834.1 MAG: RDD domain-containing protein [Limisphaerales bacterium]
MKPDIYPNTQVASCFNDGLAEHAVGRARCPHRAAERQWLVGGQRRGEDTPPYLRRPAVFYVLSLALAVLQFFAWSAFGQTDSANPKELREVIRVLTDLEIRADEEATEAAVFFGRGTMNGVVRRQFTSFASEVIINGRIDRDLVVLFGKVKLGPEADVRGKTFLIGCAVERSPGAKLAFRPVEFGTSDWFPKLRWATDYLTQGVLLLRPLPPGVSWAWVAVGMFALVYLLFQIVFPASVQAGVGTLQERPVTSLFSGLLASILFAPVCVLLVATGIGALLLPLVVMAFAVAVLVGKAAVLRFVGHQLGRQVRPGCLENGLLALITGIALLGLLYMVPVLGAFVWGTTTLLGLGAVVVAAVQHLGKENQRPAGEMPPVPTDALGAADEAALPRVGFWRRLVATLLDALLVGAIAAILSKGLLFPPFWFLYHIVLWTWKGTTIGGIVFGLKIIREDGRPMTFAVAFVRVLASVFSLLALGLGFFWAGWSREKRAWHDTIAGTIVVQAPRGMSLV